MISRRTPLLASRSVSPLLLVGVALVATGRAGSQGTGGGDGPVVVVELDGAIDKVSSRFIDRALDEADDEDAAVVLARIDPPGGLLDATRDMVGDIFGSRVPVVSYVAPEGAQAASAGTFVATAAALLAMAPATNIGAAAVVGAGGEDLPETLSRKATEDAAALIRSIADRRGRPVDPLEATVREARSYSAGEAVELENLVSPSLARLLAQLDGRMLAGADGVVPRARRRGPRDRGATARWGIKVTNVEIRELIPPREIQDAMSRQMSAERVRRAVVLEAEGTRQSNVTVAEGEKQAEILRAEGDKQAAILRAEGFKEALTRIFEAARDVDEKTMTLQYLETLKALGAGPSSKFLFPMEFTRLLEGISAKASGDGSS